MGKTVPSVPPSDPADLDEEASGNEPVLPPDTVVLTRAEHDRLQAEARTAKRRAEQLSKQQADREAAEQQEAQRAAGEFDAALKASNDKVKALERSNMLRDVRDTVREQISALGYAGARASALMRLVDVNSLVGDGSAAPDEDTIATAIEATLALYPDLFQVEGAAPEGKKPMKRTPGPATPPAARKDHFPPDYLSPEEYVDTPHAVRMTKSFQDRVANSRPHWPKIIPANTFALGQG